MKKALIAILLFLMACNTDDKAIRRMCEDIHTQYPMATLQDIYKTCYQDYFGAEHLVSDTASARLYLQRELDECRDTDMSLMPKREPTGFRHRYTRINLACVVDGELSVNQLLEMFLEAAAGRINRALIKRIPIQRMEKVTITATRTAKIFSIQRTLYPLTLARVG